MSAENLLDSLYADEDDDIKSEVKKFNALAAIEIQKEHARFKSMPPEQMIAEYTRIYGEPPSTAYENFMTGLKEAPEPLDYRRRRLDIDAPDSPEAQSARLVYQIDVSLAHLMELRRQARRQEQQLGSLTLQELRKQTEIQQQLLDAQWATAAAAGAAASAANDLAMYESSKNFQLPFGPHPWDKK